ncbi:hypothetical protein DFH09DRAFT_37652 [Mycena vulgaris]|nr:hypothetical protein DFH09DRAFT_37652 [Mycena vulgaris]
MTFQLFFFGCLLFFPLTPPVTARSPLLEFSEVPEPSLALRPQATGYDFDLEADLPAASSTLSQLPVLPANCAQFVGPGKECTTNMAAMAVTYEDCGDPFTVCRCDNANMTMDTAVDRLGRVPVGLRRFIGSVLILENVTEAYTDLSSGDIHLSGDCNMDVWVHEATHAFDFRKGSSNSPSSSQAWAQAITDDTCAPDQYSLRNELEDFAQLSVIKIYVLLHNGHLPPGFRADCMSHQLDFMNTLDLYTATNLFGNTCNIKDGSVGVRHNKTPAVLDATRVFKTVPLDTTSTSTSIPLRKSGPHSNSAWSSLAQTSPRPWIPAMIWVLSIVASI